MIRKERTKGRIRYQEGSIVIIGGNFVNKGAQLLLDTTLDLLSCYYPYMEKYIVDSFPIRVRKSYGKHRVLQIPYIYNFCCILFDSDISRDIKIKILIRSIKFFMKRIVALRLILDIKNIFYLLRVKKEVVLVIDISGYGYKIKGNDHDIMNFIQLSFGKLFKKSTYVFFPQSFGPFDVRGENPIVKQIQKHLSRSVVFARETTSLETLRSLGIEAIFWPDICLLYSFKSKDDVISLSRCYFPQNKSVIVIPNMRLYDYYPSEIVDSFYKSLLKGLIALEIPTILLMHSLDDAPIFLRLKAEFSDHNRFLFPFDKDLTPNEIETIIKSYGAVVVSGRYHGLVVSLRNHIPSIATGWAHKYEDLFELLGIGNFAFDITVPGICEQILNRVKCLYYSPHSRKELVTSLHERIKRLKEKFPLSEFISYISNKTGGIYS
ncbi:polysaccharide pyruvyl transferase family protein [Spirochaeta thermophila]|uniref:polysaccharide pyruvyl transferase family protein n=1 Tax=Winmispira thermophila TaxID=154 RepID=UPI0002D73271|nr:polysaccharide pyruvyl transferase family protein [Spirochaeta thermophila]